jgi:hypothetical protein
MISSPKVALMSSTLGGLASGSSMTVPPEAMRSIAGRSATRRVETL